MCDISDFFDSEKCFERIEISAGTVAGRTVPLAAAPRAPKKLTLKDCNDTKYAKKHVAKNRSQLLESFDNECDVDGSTPDDIHGRYDFTMPKVSNRNLPIMLYKREILDAVDENSAIVIHGATGSGKTTQVPQFILDDAFAKRKYCSIVVAQPRRIAASSNANRVAAERGWPLSTVVGYQIGLDHGKFSNDTRILYCTTQILLERLLNTRTFGHFTHIVIDEIHERSKETDFLMIVIKKLLAEAPERPKVKFILMSATIDARAFAKYFEMPKGRRLVPAKVIKVRTKSHYKISEYYVEDLMEYSLRPEEIQFKWNEPGINDKLYTMAVDLINRFESIDAKEFRPAVLVFLPGINEINRMRSELEFKWPLSNPFTRLLCVVLHSMSDDCERALAVEPAEPNVRKIILATNIAESSITVPDVKYVIDFCLARVLVTDRSTNCSSLRLNWAGRSNCIQRMGRVGRVMNGECYRLVTRHFFKNTMLDTLPSELVRSPLEHVILNIKKLNLGSPESILALAMDKPKMSDIASTVLILKEAGALLRNSAGEYTEADGDITFIGRMMADLPIDIKISRLILFGHCFGVLEECIVIGAALSCSKRMFKSNQPRQDELRSYGFLFGWANGSHSDLIAMHNAYRVWSQMRNQGDLVGDAETEWADRCGINLAAMYECKQLIEELCVRLERLEIVVKSKRLVVDQTLILKTVIAGAFFPNYFVCNTPELYHSGDVLRVINDHDPRNTVYFKGIPRGDERSLYPKQIQTILVENRVVNDSEKMQVSFDVGSEKAYITFEPQQNINKILPNVYKAVKMRKLRLIQQTKTETSLRGPFSPLEMTVHPMVEIFRSLSAIIDPISVNSVLLDTDPYQINERYLVAASVSDAKELTAHATTMMPNIRAFGPLMALIFCPTMEMKRSKDKTKFVSLRTGLGIDRRNQQPIFEERDMVFHLDTEITLEDLQYINVIRGCLNILLYVEPDQKRVYGSEEEKAGFTSKIIECILKLFTKSRKPIAVEMETFSWNSYEAADMLNLEVDDACNDVVVFPIHRVIKLHTGYDVA